MRRKLPGIYRVKIDFSPTAPQNAGNLKKRLKNQTYEFTIGTSRKSTRTGWRLGSDMFVARTRF